MLNAIQHDSKYFDYTNSTGSDIASGQLVHIGGGKIGVAVNAIPNGSKGALQISDVVVEFPKVGGALTVGGSAAIGTAGNTVTPTATALTTITNGFVWEAANSAATTVKFALD